MARDLGVPCSNKKPYYFISYNSEDEARVSVYAKELSALGVPVWYDNGIKVGVDFENEIAERIESCEAVVMFLSKNIFLKEKSYVHREFELATEYSEKDVYVVMLDDIKKPEVPVRFRPWWTSVTKLQCVNAFEYDSPMSCMQRLVESAGIKASAPTQVQSTKVADAKPALTSKRIEYENGDVYEGDLVDGKRTGKGKYTYASGAVYEGDFVNDKRHGKGKYTFVNGEVYEGDYVNDKRHGKGKYTYANGNVYEGDYTEGKRTGKGKYTFASGEVYEGDFVNGKYHGKGKYTFASGAVYEGDYVNDKRYGKGTYTYTNGNVYEGDYTEGERTGKGKYTFANGEVYEGDFVDGKYHGKGKLTYADGSVQEGYFEEGVFKHK